MTGMPVERTNSHLDAPEQVISSSDHSEQAKIGSISLETDVQEGLGPDAKRQFKAPAAAVVGAIAVIWAVFQLFATVSGTVGAMDLRGWHIVFLLLLSFLIFRPLKSEWTKNRYVTAFDLVLSLVAITPFLYFIMYYETIAQRGGFLEPLDYTMGILGIVVSLEAARRVVRNLAILAFIFLLYALFGSYISGLFGHSGYSLERLTQHLFWGSQGMFGIAIGVSSTFVFVFIVFGVFLKYSGFSGFISDIALAITGHTAGGPAKVAVLASALTGTINGSALANVATTGAITIPLMKRNGYTARFAAAVEAVSSTGGQFAPPVMGAVGFVMAEYLGLPYAVVMLAAVVPALLYYVAVLLMVHLEAKKLGLSGIARENLPHAGQVMRDKGHLIVPLVVLITLLLTGFTPLFAGVVGIVCTVAVSWLRKSTRMGPREILKSLEEGARGAIGVGVACLVIGLIIGIVSLTGLGLNLGFFIVGFTSGSMTVAAVLVMIMSIILGMGVPGVAAYVIVAAVGAPILIDAGVEPIAAHMFILFFASLSNITPPVALASYIAAGIAQTDETKVSLTAVKLGLVGFILPFMFIYSPKLLIDPDDLATSIVPTISALFAVVILAMAIQGWMLRRLNPLSRVVLFAAGLLVMTPELTSDIAGFTLSALIFLAHVRKPRRESQSLKVNH